MQKLVKIFGTIFILIFSNQQFVYADALPSELYTTYEWIYYKVSNNVLIQIFLSISIIAFFIIVISITKYLILKLMTRQKAKKGIIYDKDKTEKKKDKIQLVIYLCVIILSITLSLFWNALLYRSQ